AAATAPLAHILSRWVVGSSVQPVPPSHRPTSMTWLRRAHLTALAGGAFAMAVIFTAAPANASCAFPAKTSAYHFTGTVTAGEMASGVDSAAQAGIQALDGVGGAYDPADLHVEGQERHHLRPGVGPQPDDRRVLALPLAGELGKRVEGGLLRRCGVDRLEVFGD